MDKNLFNHRKSLKTRTNSDNELKIFTSDIRYKYIKIMTKSRWIKKSEALISKPDRSADNSPCNDRSADRPMRPVRSGEMLANTR